mmetsp:Transcript_21460/g.48616  ORF Transcript_21460/g.48616 Transcript_21460/m.48616 type:complete len:225 (-) Transcript_21460:55-729(-)
MSGLCQHDLGDLLRSLGVWISQPRSHSDPRARKHLLEAHVCPRASHPLLVQHLEGSDEEMRESIGEGEEERAESPAAGGCSLVLVPLVHLGGGFASCSLELQQLHHIEQHEADVDASARERILVLRSRSLGSLQHLAVQVCLVASKVKQLLQRQHPRSPEVRGRVLLLEANLRPGLVLPPRRFSSRHAQTPELQELCRMFVFLPAQVHVFLRPLLQLLLPVKRL